MKIVKDPGSFEILTPENFLLHQLRVIEVAGRTCYKSEVGDDSAEKFIKSLIKRGHESVLEHSLLTVKFTDVSRGFTHELVRHRHCAFSQESTRYVNYSEDGRGKFRVIVPSETADSDKTRDIIEFYEKVYNDLIKEEFNPQDARQFLPIGICSEIVISTNFREWRHIFRLRTAKDAHWEIRAVMKPLLKELRGIIPVIFDDI